MAALEGAKSLSSSSCLLGYPDRFQAAVKWLTVADIVATPLSHETKLLLYALEKQAVNGPCTKGGGWKWSAVESAKQAAWKQLGNMNAMEAMRLFVRTIEEEQADWYPLLLMATREAPKKPAAAGGDDGTAKAKAAASAPPAKADAGPALIPILCIPAGDHAVEGRWTQVSIDAQRKPVPRYEHGGALIKGTYYIIGGNYSGRYLNDAWKLDVYTMQWSPISMKSLPPGALQEHHIPADAAATAAAAAAAGTKSGNGPAAVSPLAPIAGHSVTAWREALIILGGHVKAKEAGPTMQVRVFDTISSVLANITTEGEGPCPRGGHTASLIGRRVYVFGGEDPQRRTLGDLWCLNMDTLVWEKPAFTGKPPAARSAHTAASYMGRYLVVFGGGSVATCSNDLHVLDTHSHPMQWTQPFSAGVKVTPRAGHSAALVGSVWFIVGGGNNKQGCTDLLALDLSDLGRGPLKWTTVASIPSRDPLSSEGVSLVYLGGNKKTLLAFGGYNGKFQNVISVLKVPTNVSGEPMSDPDITPATSLPAADSLLLPQVNNEDAVRAAAAAAVASKASTNDAAALELKLQLEAVKMEAAEAAREATAAKEVLSKELEAVRKELQESHQACIEAKAATAKESSKVLKLEAEAAELMQRLTSASEVQKEVERYRRAAKEEAEKAETTEKAKKGGGGLWGFIAPPPPKSS